MRVHANANNFVGRKRGNSHCVILHFNFTEMMQGVTVLVCYVVGLKMKKISSKLDESVVISNMWLSSNFHDEIKINRYH